jgi:hypothetical protein
MKKIIKLTERDLGKIINQVLLEQENSNINPKNLKLGDGGSRNPKQIEDVKILQKKLMDLGLLKTKSMIPTGYFGPLTQAALQNVGQKKQINTPLNNQTKTSQKNQNISKSFCEVITPSSDITDLKVIVDTFKKSYPSVEPYALINRTLNRYAETYASQGIPKRTSCEIALIQIRPNYKDKNVFVTDSLDKLLYLFDSNGKFIAKTPMISGKDDQSTDPITVAASLLTWSQQAEKLGFKYVKNKGYVDQTGKNRKYNHDLVYDDIAKSKGRFLPKGIYTTSSKLSGGKEYAGLENNVLHLMKGNNMLAQAIHGYYLEQPREEALRKAQQLLSNPDDPNVKKEFMDLVSKDKINLSQSYGCFNLPEKFLPYLRKYGPNSYVFNLSEDERNYLVQNSIEYFDKIQNSESCPSPKSLGAIPIENMV